ncbi:hypothetical protein GCM10009854_10480 [Saccharopolyspora halophila]|uniref:Uncharacterized protein n=1 Tax=Saccharopolyspora halophila TaxID=405551 RepID=A0ABN3FS50_9PSEU
MAAEHAVVRLELEARISEAGFKDSGLNIDPHHITTAYNELRHNAHPYSGRAGPRCSRRRKGPRLHQDPGGAGSGVWGWPTGEQRNARGAVAPAPCREA